ncbi:GNAT family N-acetyltransferase [Bacillus shivajii]|uniref:GNAT family N-acetyltransferase n=1 Tax=Bacillus shivajii TaxID=1983719 RepID=UPI001CF97F74|nr:GNAT family protein [Bacillus shivajii]UCZ53172.1 GNAT family N-acetyltransferase [Bacillus shivajii]
MRRVLKKIPNLDTKHYFLRVLKQEDAGELFPIMSDKETMKFITPHPVQTIEEMEWKTRTYLEKFRELKEIPWVIVDKDSGMVIGLFRFHKLNLWHKKAEMGVVIAKEWQGRGVMSELMESILSYGFNDLKLNRIVGDTFARNKGSEKLLAKYQFRKEGTLRQTDYDGKEFHDTVVYSLLCKEYKALNRI